MFRQVCRALILYVFDPFMLAPIGALVVSRMRPRFQRPPWLRTFIWVEIGDLVQGLGYTTLGYMGIHNLWYRHVIQPLVFAGLLLVVYQFRPASLLRKTLFGLFLLAGLVAALGGFVLDGLAYRNAIFTSTQSLVFLLVAVLEMRHSLLFNDDAPPSRTPEFWLLSALLIYASGGLIFNATSNYFLRTLPPEILLLPWLVASIVNAAYNALLAKVFLCPKPNRS